MTYSVIARCPRTDEAASPLARVVPYPLPDAAFAEHDLEGSCVFEGSAHKILVYMVCLTTTPANVPTRTRREADSEMAPQEVDIAQSGLGNGAQTGPSASALAVLSPGLCVRPQAGFPLKIWTPRAP